jgi:hypothetical protein
MAVYRRTMNVEALEVDREWMVLNAEKFTVTKLNEVGGLCWSLLKDAQTLDTLSEALSEKYGIAQEEAKGDVEPFLAELQKLGLIEYAS